MNNTVKIGCLQYDVMRDAKQNINRLKFYLQQHKCQIVILPELSMCEYLFKSREELLSYAESVPSGISTQCMLALSKRYSCTIIFGLTEIENDGIFNTAVVVGKGKYIGKYRKIHLSDYERKLFDRGTENVVFDVDGVKIGVQICFAL